MWHSQLAGWVNNIRDKAQLTAVIEKHVTELVTRYKGKIRAWVRRKSAPYSTLARPGGRDGD